MGKGRRKYIYVCVCVRVSECVCGRERERTLQPIMISDMCPLNNFRKGSHLTAS